MSDGFINVRVTRDNIQTKLQSDLKELCYDAQTKYEVNNILAEMIDKYVPSGVGNPVRGEPTLRESVKITPNYVSWNTPYAHYQYVGTVYGPNFRVVDENGNYTWRSRKGETKRPTWRPLGWLDGYSTAGTGPEWDKEMWANERRSAQIRITNCLKQRKKELGL